VLGRAPPALKPATFERPSNLISFGEPEGPANRIYVLSANDKTSLESQMQRLIVYLEQRPEVFQKSLLPNLAYTLGQRRSVLSWKVAIPTRSSAELITQLAGSSIVPSRATKEPRIGFVFTGQGAQWHAMGRELLSVFPVFASTIEKIDLCLAQFGSEFYLIGELFIRCFYNIN
jgi:acyl transferase domain-containing protein